MNRSSLLAENFAPRDRVVPVLLERQAALYADRTLLVIGATRWSYGDALRMAAGFGAALEQAGVRQGDRVAVLCGNRPEFMQAVLGCAWIGAVAVPINVASRGAQLQHVLANSGARLLVVESELLGALRSIDATALPIERLWVVGGSSEGDTAGSAGDARDETLAGRAAVAVLLFPAPCEPIAKASLKPGDTLAILYTSGTTGPSKGVCCPHAQYFWWGVHSSELLGLGEGETLHTTLPLFHTNALNAFFQALLTGSTLIVEKRFSASAFWASLVESGATVTYLLGAMVPILLAKDATPHDKSHRVRLALAPGVPEQFNAPFFERFGMHLLEGYGSTETNFVIGAELAEQRPGTMGKVRAGFEARVVDDADNEVAAGEPGELVLRASEPFSFSTGYFGMSDKTVEAWRNLWFHTGDRVVRDEGGYFKFVDRLKDAIRRRGENISSYEVEQVLLSHPAIETAAVYPVKSEMAEDEVMAAIVCRAGEALAEVDLMRFCETRMAYFAVPRYVEFVERLPATENGKVQKFKLRERGVTGTTWDREAAGYKVRR